MSKRAAKAKRREQRLARREARRQRRETAREKATHVLKLLEAAPRASTTTKLRDEGGARYCAVAFITRIPPEQARSRNMGEALVLSTLPDTPREGPPMPPNLPKMYITPPTSLVAYGFANRVREACRLLDGFAESFDDEDVSVYLVAVWRHDGASYELIEEPYKKTYAIHDFDDRWHESVN